MLEPHTENAQPQNIRPFNATRETTTYNLTN